jgi:hypothetical protein
MRFIPTGGNTPIGYNPRPILVPRPRPLRPLRPSVPYHTHSIETGGPRNVGYSKPMPRPMPKPMPRPFISPMPIPTGTLYSNASGGGCSLWMCDGY